jgi:hypothetical protein
VGEERIVNTSDGKPFLLLGHSGHSINGGRYAFDVRDDSTDWSASTCQTGGTTGENYTYPSHAAYEVHRAINQVMYRSYRDYDYMGRANPDDWEDVNTPADDRIYGLRRGSVWVTNANELAGGTAGYSPTRPAWWTIKSLDQFMLALNTQAGRTVITWAWPEHINP